MIKETLGNINSYYSRLKFTYELEFENPLSFLNLLIIKKRKMKMVPLRQTGTEVPRFQVDFETISQIILFNKNCDY